MSKKMIFAGSLSIVCASVLAESLQLPEVKIEGRYQPLKMQHEADLQSSIMADSAELLKSIPGANVNRNGALSGIVQYRGAYGDRINVSLDGEKVVSGGPNAMDAPLSYAPSSLVSDLKISRGIASVADGQENMGGQVMVTTDQGEFTDNSDVEFSGSIQTRYASNKDASSNGVFLLAANQQHKTGIRLNHDKGDNQEFDGAKSLDNSFYERSRFEYLYGFKAQDSGMNLNAIRNETNDSGTAALPMDILYIDSDLSRLQAYKMLAGGKLNAAISYNYVTHGMDNFSHRPASSMLRITTAKGNKLDYNVNYESSLLGGDFIIGADMHDTNHSAVINDPSNTAFEIHNFNQSEKQIAGLFAQWQGQTAESGWLELGLRHNTVNMQTDLVAGSGFGTMPMSMGGVSMQSVVDSLASDFNGSDLSHTHNNIDAVLKYAHGLNQQTNISVGLARKNRSPSYQEQFLWLPLKSAGGLADGRNYIGNTQLNSELAHELNLGLDWVSVDTYISVHGFYRDVRDYIQGTPVMNMNANMVSNMMGGQDALQFNNVNAKLYGAEMAYGYAFNTRLKLDGSINYVRGKRTDLDDNLYRLTPLNHRINLSYQYQQHKLSLESHWYAKQDKVSVYNNEVATDSYNVFHVRSNSAISADLNLSMGIENLLDESYQHHLTGINRVADSDVAKGERLYGAGRNAYVSLVYAW